MAEKHTFTNSAGESFELSPLNPLEEQVINQQVRTEFERAGKSLEPPFYDGALPTGEKQRVTLRSLADAGDDPDLQEKWRAYEMARLEFDEAVSRRFLDSCFLCIEADPDQCPGWLRRMKVLKIDIPTDEADRFLMFCHTWVIRGKDDIPGLIFACTSTMVKLSEDKRRAAEEMFRRQVEEAAGSVEFTA